MPLDPQVMKSLEGVSFLDPEISTSLDRTEEAIERRRSLLRDKYAWNLVAPLSGTRESYSEKAIKEVTDPAERQWLIEEVGRIAQAQSWAKEKKYAESGLIKPGFSEPAFIGGRFGVRAQQVGGAFAEAGTAMTGAAADFRDWIQCRGRTVDEVRFKRQLEAAKQGADPSLGRDAPLSLRAAAGMAGMAPDLSAGLLAGATAGPWAMAGYWTARLFPERNEDYLEMGLSPAAAATAGAVTAAIESAIELLNIDPTGVSKGVVAQLAKGVARRAVSDAIKKYGGKRLIALTTKYPAIRTAIGAGLDALERVGGETIEEGLQRGVRDVGKYLAAKTDEKIEGPVFSSIAPAMWQEMKDALPAIAALGGGPGMVSVTGEYMGAQAEVKRASVEKEILEYADQGKTPSRGTRIKWGLPEEGWESRKQRREGVQQLAQDIRSQAEIDEQAKAMLEAPPEAAQKAGEIGREAGVPMATIPGEVAPEAAGAAEVGAGAKQPWEMTREEFDREFWFHGRSSTHPQGTSEEITGGIAKDIRTAREYAGQARGEEGGHIALVRQSEFPQSVRDELEADPGARSIGGMGTTPATAAAWFPAGVADPYAYFMEKAAPEVTPEVTQTFTIPEVMSEPGGAPLRSGENAQAGPPPGEHGMTVETEGTGEVVSARKVVVDLEKLWGIPLERGGVRGKAAGIYKRHGEIARLARGQESAPAVAMHEIAHHVAKKHPILLKGLKEEETKELKNLDYDQEERRSGEGFAEYVRGYVTGSTHLEEGIDLGKVAPNFTRSFEAVLKGDPELAKRLQDSQGLMQEWQKAGAVGRVKGQVGQPDPTSGLLSARERAQRLFDLVYTKIKEEGLPIKRFVQAAEKRGYTPGEEKTTAFEDYNALRRTGEHFAASALEDGVFLLTGDMKKVGPSLKEALMEVEPGADYENFRAWAYARHAVESWGKGKNPGITLADAKETQARLYDPKYERAADKLTEFGNGLVLVLEDVGEISAEESKRIREYYKTHIPLMRVQEGKLTAGMKMRGAGGRKGLKGRKGSGLPIADPVESLMARAIQTYDRASKRIVVNKIIRTAETIEGLGGWVDRVPPGMIPTQFKLEEIKGQLVPVLEKAGIDPDEVLGEMDPMTALTVWRPEALNIRGQPVFRHMVEGKAEYYQIRPDLLESLGGLETHHNLDIATTCARHFMGALKIGATRLNPSFVLVTNPAKDYQTFLMQGEKGLRGAVDPAEWACAWVYSEVQRATGQGAGDPVVQSFRRMGGELSTYVGLDRYRLQQAARYAKRGRHGWATVGMNITGTPEVAPRLAEYAAMLDKFGWLERVKNGEAPPAEILYKCINAAHDVTVDFRRMGPWGRYLNYWIPFSNAKLEGLDKFVRTFKDHPARSLLRVGTQIVPIALMYWWLRHDDDDYKERPEWQDGFWTLADSDGRPIIRIPRPHEWGLLSAGIERMLDAAYDRDPESITRWFKQAWRTAVPDAYPVGATSLFETMFNYDHFRQRAIVPEHLQRLEPIDQAFEYNTALVKHAAKFMYDYSGGKVNLSPAKIEHLADGLTGGMYSRVEKPIEKAISGDPWAAHDVPGLKGITLRKEYTKSVGDLYALQKQLSQQKKSAATRDSKFDPQKNADLHELDQAIKLLGKLRKMEAGQPEEVREQIERAMTGVARTALNRPPLVRYPDPRYVENALPELQSSDGAR